MMRSAILVLSIPVMLALSERALASEEWRQGNNYKMLPQQYCHDRMDPERWKKWRDYFGPVYIHMHHYCGGIYTEMKARGTLDKDKRDQWLGETIDEMRYVSRYCDPTCVIYADLHKRWAWALSAQGNFAEAMKHIELMKAARPSGVKPPTGPSAAR